ncbi:MAG: DUF4489 domain-containing protein [Marinisporobacter sp.]|jgi:hypothetical protein|nr:DUF4489 domain-containing protein [Marinisporobacter sp.]
MPYAQYDCASSYKKDCVKCEPAGHPLPKPIIMSCGTGNGFTLADSGTTPETTTVGCPPCRPKTVAALTLDTTCLCKPMVKIEFSSHVHFVPTDNGCTSDCQLEFELVRICDNGFEDSLGTWLFEIEEEGDVFAETFNFIYCECNTCPGCCRYFVRVVPLYIDDATVCVGNTFIAGFAQSGCD